MRKNHEGLTKVTTWLDDDLVARIDEVFCKVTVSGRKVHVRSRSSVVREAILRGLPAMIDLKRELIKKLGDDTVFLEEFGVGIASFLYRMEDRVDGGSGDGDL